ncbi:MAG: GrpB family protein [Thermomicrobiales bacterium]
MPPSGTSLSAEHFRLGLSSAEVRHAVEHAAWAAAFAQEAALLLKVLGPAALGVEHVGSTAVPGLTAKPILDLLVGVERVAVSETLTPALLGAGYEHRPSGDTSERRYYVKGTREWRLAHLSLIAVDSEGYREQIAFRDMLRGDSLLVEQYAALKRALADRYPDDRVAYTDGKAAFIREALARGVRE